MPKDRRGVRRYAMALALLGLFVAMAAVVYFLVDTIPESSPVQRANEQNSGVDAPLDQALSPGTVKDKRGDAKLPEQLENGQTTK